jgi:hypothetical protein
LKSLSGEGKKGQGTEIQRTLRGTTRMAINRNAEILAYPSSCCSKHVCGKLQEYRIRKNECP